MKTYKFRKGSLSMRQGYQVASRSRIQK